MIIHKENLIYQHHCKTSCGTYVLAHNEPDKTNTNAPRALDCLYLRPTASGCHECLHLQTNKVITRRRVTPSPLTPDILKLIHSIAEQDEMPKGLKISNRFGTILFDSSWIAGVDYNEGQFEDEDYDDNDSDNDDKDQNALDNENYDTMDPNEVANILQDRTQNAGVDEPQEPQEFQNEEEEIVFKEEPEEEEQEEQTEDTPAEEEEDPPYITRSGRLSRPPTRLHMYQAQQHLETTEAPVEEYTRDTAQVIANVMYHWNNVCQAFDDQQLMMFIQTYSLNKRIMKFGQKGMDAATKEMKQLHNRTVFEGITIQDMTPLERKRAMESLIFLVEKCDGKLKARTCANGSTQREYINREDATSPTAATNALLITGVLEAKQGRDVMTNSVPSAFVQTPIPQDGEKIIMKIQGQLVDMLLEIAPEMYEPYVVYEGKKKVLYVRMLKALYGMLISSILYYKKFCTVL
jgi:hypothetical protein